MKWKSSSYNPLKDPRINNIITIINLKIKDIHILLDDIDTNKKSYSMSKNYKKNIDSYPNSTLNSHKIYYTKRMFNHSEIQGKRWELYP